MNNEAKIEVCEEGVKITFPLITLAANKFNALMGCLRRNREAGNITIPDAHCDKDNIFHITVTGIDGVVPEFIALLKFEMMVADINPPDFCSKNTQEEIRKVLRVPFMLDISQTI